MSTQKFHHIPLTTTSRDTIAYASGEADLSFHEDGTLRSINELHVYDVGHTLLEILPADPLYRPIADALHREVNSSINARSSKVDTDVESA